MSYAGLTTLPSVRAESILVGRYASATNLKKYISAFTEQMDELQSINKSTLEDRYLAVAINKELEVLGEIVGQERGADKDTANEFFGFYGAVGAGTFGSTTMPASAELFKSLSDIEYIYTTQDDEVYRSLIKAKIIKNSEAITIDALIRILKLIVPRLTDISIVEGNAQVHITFPVVLTNIEKLTLKEGKYVPKPAGVNYTLADTNGTF